MKKIITSAFALCLSAGLFAQTPGTLIFSFTEVNHSPNTYNGNQQHVLAVWIQTSAGAFVKTRLRRVGSGTKDHLPTWASNSGGSSTNATSSSCNVVGATTGATLSTFGTYNITWDGTNAAGVLQPDGAYRVAIQSTWDHGNGFTTTTYYNFTKGATTDHQTPASDANFTTITLNWAPSGVGIDEENPNPQINVYPNPSTGIFNIELLNVKTIKVVNMLGSVVFEEKVNTLNPLTSIDLSEFSNGIYFIAVTNEIGTTNKKVVLNK